MQVLFEKLSYLNVPPSAVINSSLHCYSTFHPEALSCVHTMPAGIISRLWNEEVVEDLPGAPRRHLRSGISALI